MGSVTQAVAPRSVIAYNELVLEVEAGIKRFDAAQKKHSDTKSAKAATRAYDCCCSIRSLLSEYPEILGPAKALDNQYGGVVFPSLGMLWKVISSKNRFEERMQIQLKGLITQFKHLQRYKKIYHDEEHEATQQEQNRIEELVKGVFEGIAEFLRSSAAYYEATHGHKRFFHSLSPYKDDPSLDTVRDLLQEVLAEVAILLSRDASEARKNTARIMEQLEQQQRDHESEKYAEFGRLLHITQTDQQASKSLYARQLDMAWQFNRKRVPRLDQVWDIFQADSVVGAWQSSKQSSLLIVSGFTSNISGGQRFCWLSAASMSMIDRAQANEQPIAFHMGQLGCNIPDWMIRTDDIQALDSLIYQIVGWDPSIMGNDAFEKEVSAPLRSVPYDKRDLSQQRQILQALLNLVVGPKPIYILLDGISSPSCSTRDDSRPALARELLELVKNVQGVVKVVLIGLNDDFSKRKLDIFKDSLDPEDQERFHSRLSWDSATIWWRY